MATKKTTAGTKSTSRASAKGTLAAKKKTAVARARRSSSASRAKPEARRAAPRSSKPAAAGPKPAARRASAAGRRASAARSLEYRPQTFEQAWMAKWDAAHLYRTRPADDRPKAYILDFFPYPSGDGLSVGHCRNYVPTDVLSRYQRMRGYNVLHPMGWDAFGLPAENAAIKLKTNPAKLIDKYSANYKRQFRLLGISFDWDREINSSKPEYYRWTQWMFLQLYQAWFDPRLGRARPIADLEAELAQRGTRALPGADALTAEAWTRMSLAEKREVLGTFRLAYRAPAEVNWDPVDKTVLANEEVVDGRGWRSGALVERKRLMQWFFRITAYAERLLADLDTIDWPEHIKTMQRNWIGRSQGAEVDFATEAGPLRVFTTRPDTLWGATFMVLAPEHPSLARLTSDERRAEVEAYCAAARRMSEADRTAVEKEKTGVFTGAYAVNPVDGRRIPVWVADYVLSGYGTGAIMAVPGHDERDFAFALKFGLPILPVIDRTDGLTKSFALGGTMKEGFAEALRREGIPFNENQGSLYITLPPAKIDRYIEIAAQHVQPDSWNEIVGTRWLFIFADGVQRWDGMEAEQRILTRCHALEPDVRSKRTIMEMLHAVEFYRDALFHAEYGAMIHSGAFSGTPGQEAVMRVTEWLEAQGTGVRRVNYKLRDWGISRQRYWGTPIPVVHTDLGEVAVREEDLPVRLPDVDSYEPTATGESPLATIPKFVNVTLPDGTRGRRETDTMGTFACSSWYFLRFADPHNNRAAFDKQQVAYWLPVDVYVGGAEHAVMHLLYARFWTKVLQDLGHLPFGEPFLRLRNQGMILAPDGKEKMSKSKGNVITPDEVIAEYGADALRAYEMFISDFEQTTPWNTNGLAGTYRWLRRAWELMLARAAPPAATDETEVIDRDLRRIMHKTIRKVAGDIEGFRFNTAISALMEYTNAIGEFGVRPVSKPVYLESLDALLLLLAPIAPFLAEEVWHRLGHKGSVHQQRWPAFDPALAVDETITLVLQVNGKVRDRLTVPADISEPQAREMALASENVQRWLEGKTPRQVVVVKGRLVNIVV
jgi:leucyl-tRNA synthetase